MRVKQSTRKSGEENWIFRIKFEALKRKGQDERLDTTLAATQSSVPSATLGHFMIGLCAWHQTVSS